MRFQGKITNWQDDKGFGFVEPNGGGNRAFVHIKSFSERSRRPNDSDIIVYQQIQAKDGRFKATKVNFVRDIKKNNTYKKPTRKLGSIITIIFCSLLIVLTATGKLAIQITSIYLVTSLISFLAYAIDKSAAQNNRWRTKESTLHILSLFGGWPGAFYAQNKLRHKSNKDKFKTIFWLTAIINSALLFWFITENGSKFFSTIISF